MCLCLIVRDKVNTIFPLITLATKKEASELSSGAKNWTNTQLLSLYPLFRLPQCDQITSSCFPKRGVFLHRWQPTAIHPCITLSLHSRSIFSLKRKSGLLLIVFRLIDWLTGGDRKSLWELHCECESSQGAGLGLRSESLWTGRHKGARNHIWLFGGPPSSPSSIDSLTAHMHTSTLNSLLRTIYFSRSVSWVRANTIIKFFTSLDIARCMLQFPN